MLCVGKGYGQGRTPFLYESDIDDPLWPENEKITPRKTPALQLQNEYDALAENALQIGTLLVSDPEHKRVPEVAARLGADFYIPTTKKATIKAIKGYSWQGDDYTHIGKTTYITKKYEVKHKYVDAYYLLLYRRTLEDLDLDYRFEDCISECDYCTDYQYDSWDPPCQTCSPSAFEKFLKKGISPNRLMYSEVPVIYELFDCITGGVLNPEFKENYLFKLNIMFDAGLDPNIVPRELKYTPTDEVPNVLKNTKPPYPTILKITRNEIISNKKILESKPDILPKYYSMRLLTIELLEEIDKLLVAKGAKE